jgi:hypothetical protein
MLVLGWALAGVPNVELLTLTGFLGGWVLAPLRGAVAAGLGALFFSLLNPFGPPLPAVLAAQVAGLALVGAAGGWVRSAVVRRPGISGWRPSRWTVLWLGTTGALLTLLYDAGTNAGHALAMGLGKRILPTILAGISFAVLHVASNGVLFAVLGPPALVLLEERLPGGAAGRRSAPD